MDAGVPLHQIPEPASPRPPLVYLLYTLRLCPPQLACDHPLPNRLPANLHVMLFVEIFGCQRRSKTPVDVLRQNLDRPTPFRFFDPPVGWKPSQGMNHGLVAAFLQLMQQPPYVPLRDPQFLCRLLLSDQLLLSLLQRHQPVPLGLRHQQLSFLHLPSLNAVNRTFLLGTNRTLSFGGDSKARCPHPREPE